MMSNDDRTVRAGRLRRYDRIRQESSVGALRTAATAAFEDAKKLIAAGDVAMAAGAVTDGVRAMLLLALAPSGSREGPAARDLATKRSMITKFDEIGLPIAAVMVAAAVAYEESILSRPTGATEH